METDGKYRGSPRFIKQAEAERAALKRRQLPSRVPDDVDVNTLTFAERVARAHGLSITELREVPANKPSIPVYATEVIHVGRKRSRLKESSLIWQGNVCFLD